MSQFSKTELLSEARWRKCAADPVYFFENYWHIQHPEQGAILFSLFDAQAAALATFMAERYVITLKARQIGWTTIVAAYAFWLAFFHPDRTIIFLSKGEREAKLILDKVKYGYKRLPEWLRKRGPVALRDNLQEMPFDNGSSIESLPSKSDPARGRTVYLIVVDEWAFLDNAEEAWASIEATTDVGGRCIGLSTANGSGTFFEEMWDGAQNATNQFMPIFEPWSARDDRDANWYEVKKATLPAWQLHQEYPTTPEEAFIKSGNPFFDVDKLALIECAEWRSGHLAVGDGRTFIDAPNGALEILELPVMGDRYVVGADVAEGLEHGDYSSAHVKRLRTGEVVAHWHGHIPADEFGQVLFDLGSFYNRALVGVENNNHGLTTLTELRRLKYPNIFYTRSVDDRTRKMTQKMGWTTSRKTKPLMLDELASALRDDSIVIRHKPTIGELRRFVRDDQAKLHGSPFDDRTMSLAITEMMSEHSHQSYTTDGAAAEWGSLAFFDAQIDAKKRGDGSYIPIGVHNRRS